MATRRKGVDPKELYKVPEVVAVVEHVMRLVQQVPHLYAALMDEQGKVQSQVTAIEESLKALGFHAEFIDVKVGRKVKKYLSVGIPNPKLSEGKEKRDG